MKYLPVIRLMLVTALLVAAILLFLGPSEVAYLRWASGGEAPPSQLTRDLLALGCVVAAGVLAWVGRLRS